MALKRGDVKTEMDVIIVAICMLAAAVTALVIARRPGGLWRDVEALVIGSVASLGPIFIYGWHVLFLAPEVLAEELGLLLRLWLIWGSLGATCGWWIGRHARLARHGPPPQTAEADLDRDRPISCRLRGERPKSGREEG